MSDKQSSRRWIILAFVAAGIAVAAMLPRSASKETERSDSEPVKEEEARAPELTDPGDREDGGMASRRVREDCDPIDESLEYDGFVDKRALVILSWDGMSKRAADLEIPVKVVGIEDGAIGVRFLQFPMRAQYLNIWLGSGHIEQGENDVFLLDPCSSTIVEWPEMERDDEPE